LNEGREARLFVRIGNPDSPPAELPTFIGGRIVGLTQHYANNEQVIESTRSAW